ncbi:MAG: hypothetical protein WCF16_03905 [Alphaproteobacteria bacterium]
MALLFEMGRCSRLARIALIGLAVVIVAALSVQIACVAISAYANSRADQLLSDLRAATREDTVLNIAKWASREFKQTPTSPFYVYLPVVYRGHARFHWLGIPRGSLDFLIGAGQCSELTRIFEFLGARVGISVAQTDLSGPNISHSAISAYLGDHWVFLDPLNGLAFAEDGKLISFDRLRELSRSGRDPMDYAIKLRETPKTGIYQRERLAKTDFSIPGGQKPLRVWLPRLDSALILGSESGDIATLTMDLFRSGMAEVLTYLGPRYPGSFERVRVLSEAGQGFRITFFVDNSFDPKDAPFSNVEPEIGRGWIRYTVPQSSAYLDLDYSRMGDWYWVRHILIEPHSG